MVPPSDENPTSDGSTCKWWNLYQKRNRTSAATYKLTWWSPISDQPCPFPNTSIEGNTFFLIILTGSRTQDCQMLNFILSTAAASWTVRVLSLRSLNDMFRAWNLMLLHFSSSRASRARLQDPDSRGRGPGTNRRLGLRPRGADGQAGHRPQAGDGQEAQGPGGPVEEGKGGGPRSVPAGEKGTSIVNGCYSQSYSHWWKVIMGKLQPSISLVDEWIRMIRLINQTYLLVGYVSPLV